VESGFTHELRYKTVIDLFKNNTPGFMSIKIGYKNTSHFIIYF
jgi:hypothetical protein